MRGGCPHPKAVASDAWRLPASQGLSRKRCVAVARTCRIEAFPKRIEMLAARCLILPVHAEPHNTGRHRPPLRARQHGPLRTLRTWGRRLRPSWRRPTPSPLGTQSRRPPRRPTGTCRTWPGARAGRCPRCRRHCRSARCTCGAVAVWAVKDASTAKACVGTGESAPSKTRHAMHAARLGFDALAQT
eukprot:364721-Chlamydomonas_euryale.AAC.13